MAAIELRGICKKYTSKEQVFSITDLDLTVPDGTTLVILGPSGCGKTTLLRLVAGLEKPKEGVILFDGQDIRNLPPGQRKIGMVFQNLALYPHFTAKENILSHFLFTKKKKEVEELAEDRLKETSRLLEVKIEHLMDKMPKNLSGGEKQRVALGRCITREPDLFLLDEPFSNLDAPLRAKYRLHLKKLLRKFSITTIYVTHDQAEAFVLGDAVAVMREGAIVQQGDFHSIYEDPCDMFTADFLNIHTDVPAINFIPDEGLDTVTGVRPADIIVHTEEKPGYCPVRHYFTMPTTDPAHVVLETNMNDRKIFVRAPADLDIVADQLLWLEFKKSFRFRKDNGKRFA